MANAFTPKPSPFKPVTPTPARTWDSVRKDNQPTYTPSPSGTYNPTTGIYTNPSGQKQSYPSAPSGSTIVGGGNGNYTGGGSDSGFTFPVVTPPTVEQINTDIKNLPDITKTSNYYQTPSYINNYNNQVANIKKEINQYNSYYQNTLPLINTQKQIEQIKSDNLENNKTYTLPKNSNSNSKNNNTSGTKSNMQPEFKTGYIENVPTYYGNAPPLTVMPSGYKPSYTNILSKKGQEYAVSNPLLSQGYNIASFGLALGTTTATTIYNNLNPLNYPKMLDSTISLLAQPDKAIQELNDYGSQVGVGLKISPATTLGQVGGTVLGFELSGKIGGKVIEKGFEGVKSIKYAELNLPSEVGINKIKVFGIETGKGRSLPIFTKTPEGIKLGGANINNYIQNIKEGSDIKIGTALETKLIEKSIKENNIENDLRNIRINNAIEVNRNIIRNTLKVNSKFIDEKNLFTATQRLPEEAIKVSLNIARDNEGILFGSKSRDVQLAKEFNINNKQFVLNKVPRDIEFRFDKLDEVGLQDITSKYIESIKNLGKIERDGKVFDLTTTRQIMSDTGFPEMSVEAKINNQYEKIAEFKGKGNILEGEEVPEKVLGIKKTGKTIKIGNYEVTKLNEELRGVEQGINRLTKREGKIDIFPPEKRMKDIGSVYVSVKTLEMSTKNIMTKLKLQNNIREFEKLYPEELIREQVKKVLNEPEKNLIADYSKRNSDISKSLKEFSQSVSKELNYVKFTSPSKSSTSFEKSVSKVFSDISKSVSNSPSSSSSISPYKSPSISKSPSPSKVSSNSISKSPYPSTSQSPYPYPSPSPSPYNSNSPYKSPSKSNSPSKSTSPYKSPYLYPPIKTFNPIIILQQEKNYKQKTKSLGTGYNVYGKQLKSTKLFQINSSPLTKSRAEDVGAYYVTQTLARTFVVKKAGKSAQEDYQFAYVPSGYFRSQEYKLRNYRIKNRNPINYSDERFIQRSRFLLDTKAEKRDIQAFRKMASKILQ